MPLFYCMFDEDLSVFFKSEHGSQFVHQKSGRIFNGIIDSEYVEINEISGNAPVITCTTEDAKSFARGDVIEHGAKLYKFILSEPDGTGVSRLILQDA